jgi:hypothetical protein
MPGYKVYCEECDAEYDLYIEENEVHNKPAHCSYCSTELNESNITPIDDLSEEEWDEMFKDIDEDWER